MTRTVGAIVLAGGRSSRFGSDKLAVSVDGRTILERAIDAAWAVADEVVVVMAADGVPPSALRPGVRVIRDPGPFEGPLVAIASGLGALSTDRVLIVAGDMPWLVPAVLRHLVDALHDEGLAATILETDGRAQLLPTAVRKAAAASAAGRLIDGGERRLGALLEALRPAHVPAAIWRVDDPDGTSLRDVDEPADLDGSA